MQREPTGYRNPLSVPILITIKPTLIARQDSRNAIRTSLCTPNRQSKKAQLRPPISPRPGYYNPFRWDVTRGMNSVSRHAVIHRQWRCKCLSNPLSRETTGPLPLSFFYREPLASFYLAPSSLFFHPSADIFPASVFYSPRIRDRRELAGIVNHGYWTVSILLPLARIAIKRILDIRRPAIPREGLDHFHASLSPTLCTCVSACCVAITDKR